MNMGEGYLQCEITMPGFRWKSGSMGMAYRLGGVERWTRRFWPASEPWGGKRRMPKFGSVASKESKRMGL